MTVEEILESSVFHPKRRPARTRPFAPVLSCPVCRQGSFFVSASLSYHLQMTEGLDSWSSETLAIALFGRALR